ncbi:MAG: thiamine phosphate synthase [Robiginitomaculum sp.]
MEELFQIGQEIRAARGVQCRLPALTLMSDPARIPDICAAARAMPRESGLIYRHFGNSDAERTARKLRQICFARDMVFLIGKDANLAIACGADGVHFPSIDIEGATLWRARCPDWVISAAVHDGAQMTRANAAPLDAVIVSSVFESASISAGKALEVGGLNALANNNAHPIIALGGIRGGNARALIGARAAGIAGVSFT